MTDRPLFFFGLLSMIIGSQFFLTGFVSEIVIRNKKSDPSEIFKKNWILDFEKSYHYFTSLPLRGGISESTELLYLEYINKEVDCQIISYNLQYPKFLFPGKKQTILDPEKKNFNILPLLNSINPISWYRTSKYINLQKPDYVIFRFWNPFFSFCLGFIALFLKDVKKVGWVDNVFPHRKIPFQKILIKFFLKKMDAFIVMSESVKNDLNKFKINVPVYKSLHPLYNNFGAMLDKKLARRKLKVDLNYNYIFFLGLLENIKV